MLYAQRAVTQWRAAVSVNCNILHSKHVKIKENKWFLKAKKSPTKTIQDMCRGWSWKMHCKCLLCELRMPFITWFCVQITRTTIKNCSFYFYDFIFRSFIRIHSAAAAAAPATTTRTHIKYVKLHCIECECSDMGLEAWLECVAESEK